MKITIGYILGIHLYKQIYIHKHINTLTKARMHLHADINTYEQTI